MAFSNTILPAVAPVQAGGNALAAMRNMSALGKESAESQYAPYQAYGNAFLTNQQAKWLPFQYQMQAMANPLLWMAAQKDPNLQKQLSSMVQNPMMGMVGQNSPNVPMPGEANTPLNYLLGKVGYGSQASSPNAMQQGGSPMQSGPQASDSAKGGFVPSSPLPGTPNNPLFQANTGTATSEAQGTANAAQMKDLTDTAGAGAVEAQNTLNDEQRFKANYPKLKWYERGPIIGDFHPLSSAAQNTDTASSSMRASILKQAQQGHITDKDVDTFGNIKPARNLQPESAGASENFLEGASRRAQERLDFVNAASNKGLTAPQINLLWTKYINERPFFNPDTNQLNSKNMNSWGDYLQDKKMGSILNATDTDRKSVNDSQSENNSSEPQITLKNPKTGEIVTLSLKEAKRRGYKDGK